MDSIFITACDNACILRIPHTNRACFPEIYFDHTGPECITHAHAFSTIGIDQHQHRIIHTRNGDTDDCSAHRDVYSASRFEHTGN
jgi:hypothetical protein